MFDNLWLSFILITFINAKRLDLIRSTKKKSLMINDNDLKKNQKINPNESESSEPNIR